MSKSLETVVVRFAGDSGDGMQLTGTQLTNASAYQGNDVHTLPDYPAEIRAPAGSLNGISGFQVNFSHAHVHTPGDLLDVLVVMNPAALVTNINDLKQNGILVVNTNNFQDKDFKKAKLENNPLTDGSLDGFRVFDMPMSDLTLNALASFDMTRTQMMKSKNMFALGVVYWLYTRDIEITKKWIAEKFGKDSLLTKANQAALQAGYNYALTTELFAEQYSVKPATLKPGRYRQITGNQALALACAAATVKTDKPLLLSRYPITPASAIMHEISNYQHFGITTFQAEDEIAAMCATVGAAYGGSLAVTSTSGPGMDLKAEAMGLAVMTELPMVIIDVQRGGPSTGMPTKMEQADLLMSIYGRHGETPLPVLAASSPSDCFYRLLEAFRIAYEYMTPVILLSDANLANAAEPWLIPDFKDLPDIPFHIASDAKTFSPANRDKKTLAREWALPGMAGFEHRIGGLERDFKTGNISYDPGNHQKMVDTRAQKIQNVKNILPPLDIIGNTAFLIIYYPYIVSVSLIT